MKPCASLNFTCSSLGQHHETSPKSRLNSSLILLLISFLFKTSYSSMASSRLEKIDFALLTDNSFDPLPHAMLHDFLLCRLCPLTCLYCLWICKNVQLVDTDNFCSQTGLFFGSARKEKFKCMLGPSCSGWAVSI